MQSTSPGHGSRNICGKWAMQFKQEILHKTVNTGLNFLSRKFSAWKFWKISKPPASVSGFALVRPEEDTKWDNPLLDAFGVLDAMSKPQVYSPGTWGQQDRESANIVQAMPKMSSLWLGHGLSDFPIHLHDSNQDVTLTPDCT